MAHSKRTNCVSLIRFSLPLFLLACMDYRVEDVDKLDPYSDTAPSQEQPQDSAVPMDTDPPAEPDDSQEPDPQDYIGCSDGQREGFESLGAYPYIAACSGSWSVGGVTRDDLAPTCGRNAGDDSSNYDGNGCSAADLCSEGWHVCLGKTEVERFAPSGCSDAVPAGTPDKSLFFAVYQNSDSDSQCDDSSSNGNDVFGCGNLGTELDSSKNCGVLDHVLASMNADSCGFNEAEPPLGPWECSGGSDSHLMEGTLVTKIGCPSYSCSYDGYPVGNSDKGGVLCCAD